MKIKQSNIEWVYVNLASRPDRKSYVEGELARVGISAKRFDALTGEDYDGPPTTRTSGQRGCLMSHLRLIEEARGTTGVLGIVEDDVMFCDDLSKRLAYIEEHFNKPWDIFFLGSTYHINPSKWHKDTLGRDFEQTDIKYIHRIYGTWNTYAYLLNCKNAEKVASLMRANMHRSEAADRLLIRLQPKLNCYCFTPGAAFQKDGPSDIGEPGEPRAVTLFAGFLTMGPYVFTRLLEDFDYASFDWAEGKRP